MNFPLAIGLPEYFPSLRHCSKDTCGLCGQYAGKKNGRTVKHVAMCHVRGKKVECGGHCDVFRGE